MQQRLKHSDVSAAIELPCHLLPIDDTSNGLRLIAQYRHIVQCPPRPGPDNFEPCHHIDRLMCTILKRDKIKTMYFSVLFCSFNSIGYFGYFNFMVDPQWGSKAMTKTSWIPPLLLLLLLMLIILIICNYINTFISNSIA